jgi:hypothetical protein
MRLDGLEERRHQLLHSREGAFAKPILAPRRLHEAHFDMGPKRA